MSHLPNNNTEETKVDISSNANEKVSQLIEKIKQWNKQKRWTFITPEQLGELMRDCYKQKSENMLQIIDVRHGDQDYIGGHINGAKNIDCRVFKDSLPNILQMYANKENFILHCMYSQCRGLRCLRNYRDYIENIIWNKYYKHLRDDKNNNMDMIIQYKDSKSKRKSFTFSARLAEDIMNQKIFVLKGGFNAWITYYYKMKTKERKFYIVDFKESYWNIKQTDNHVELKHKNDW
eukprot:233622_1